MYCILMNEDLIARRLKNEPFPKAFMGSDSYLNSTNLSIDQRFPTILPLHNQLPTNPSGRQALEEKPRLSLKYASRPSQRPHLSPCPMGLHHLQPIPSCARGRPSEWGSSPHH